MKEKKLIGHQSINEACKIARERALEDRYGSVAVYIERDGSYTIAPDNTKNSKFHLLVDKSGARFRKQWKRDAYGKREIFVRIN